MPSHPNPFCVATLLTSAIEDGWRLLFSPLSVCLLLTKSKDFVSILITSGLSLFVCVFVTYEI